MKPPLAQALGTWMGTVLLTVSVWLLLGDHAFAQGFSLVSNFRCYGTVASGDLISRSGACPDVLDPTNIFSFTVCHVEAITSQVFGNLYCGVIAELAPAVTAVLTLAVLFFGVGFTIGVISATGREFLLFMLKIAFVWAFATQAEYLIGYGYNFLVAGLRDGTAVVLSVLIPPEAGGTGARGVAAIYGQLDEVMAQIVGLITSTVGATWSNTTSQNPCKNAIFAAIVVMGIAFPPLFLLSLMLFAKIIMVFLRACFGYLFSIVGIAFLLTLSPIFLSMSLFRQTRPSFDKYLGYLVSFAMQIVIVFSFLAFVLSMNVSSITDSIVDLVVPVQETPTTSAMRWPWQYCTLCKFKIVDQNGAEKDLSTTPIDLNNDRAVCRNPNSQNPSDRFTILQTVTPATETSDVNILMQFTGTAIISLLILAYIVDRILDYAPAFAWRLASGLSGGIYTPQIGGGGGVTKVTFGPLELMETTGEGFVRGFSAGSNSLSGVAGGVREATGSFFFGHGRGPGADEGLVNSFMRFFIDPQRGSPNM